MNRLRTTQNHFIRIILKKKKRDSSFPLYKELNIFPVEHLFVYKVLRQFYLKSGNIASNNFSYATRGCVRKDLKLPKVNKSLFRKSNTYLGPKYFNALPLEIKNCTGLNKVSKKIKEWLFAHRDVFILNDVLA